MTASEKLKEVRKLLFGNTELARMTLEDGTVLEAEAFESGQDVFVVREEENIPAPTGEHTLEDGRVMVVEEEGVIAEIKAAEGGDEDLSLENERLKDEIKSLKEANENLESEKSKIEKDQEALSAEKDNLTSQKEKLEGEKAEISKQKDEIAAEKTELEKAQVPGKKHSPEKGGKNRQVQTSKQPMSVKDRIYARINS